MICVHVCVHYKHVRLHTQESEDSLRFCCTHDCVQQASQTLGSQMCTTPPALLGI